LDDVEARDEQQREDALLVLSFLFEYSNTIYTDENTIRYFGNYLSVDLMKTKLDKTTQRMIVRRLAMIIVDNNYNNSESIVITISKAKAEIAIEAILELLAQLPPKYDEHMVNQMIAALRKSLDRDENWRPFPTILDFLLQKDALKVLNLLAVNGENLIRISANEAIASVNRYINDGNK
jgi:hypothetical protein